MTHQSFKIISVDPQIMHVASDVRELIHWRRAGETFF